MTKKKKKKVVRDGNRTRSEQSKSGFGAGWKYFTNTNESDKTLNKHKERAIMRILRN